MSKKLGAVRAVPGVSIAAVIACAWMSGCTPGVSARVKRNGVVSMETVVYASPEVLLRGDFNGDGLGDIVLSRAGGVTVLLYSPNTSGEYEYLAVDIDSPTALGPAYGGNFDRDAFRDMVVATAAGLAMITDAVAPGGGASVPIVPGPVAFGPQATCLSDFDGDGDDDLATCIETSPDPSTLRVYINTTPTGQDTLPSNWVLQQTIQDLPAPPFSFDFTSVSVGRINDDAHPDLLVSNDVGCFALAGNGDGTFDPIDPITGATIDGGALSTGAVPGITGVIAGVLEDLDGDGDAEMILNVFSTQPNQIVRFGNGDGTFGPSQFFGAGVTGHRSPVTGDFNGDGTLDIVTLVSGSSTTESTNQVCLTLVNPNGTLQPTQCTPTLNRPTSAALFQPEPDQPPGLIVAAKFDHRVMLHRNINGTLSGLQRFVAEGTSGARDLAVGDLTGDGYPDVFFSTMSTFNQVLVNRGDNSGRIDATPIAAQNASNVSPIVFVPRPGLSAGTVVLARASNNSLFFSEMVDDEGTPVLRFTTSQALPGTPRDIITGDFDSDGFPEPLALLTTANPGAAVAFQSAGGVFASPQGFDLSAANTPQGWWTGCGLIDVIGGADGLAVCGPGGAGVLINNGTGFDFFPAMDSSFSGGVRVASGDLNGDGRCDLVVARSLSSTTGALAVALDNGTGAQSPTFASPTTINLIGSPGGLGLSDLDHDGDQDIGVVCNDGSPTQHWTVTLLNNGAGLFPSEDTTTHLCGTTPRELVIADLHHPAGTLVRGVPPSTAGAEFIIASGGPPATNFEGVLVLMNQADFAAPPPACPGDADGNGTVNFADITNVLTNFGMDYTPGTGPGDADHNGPVNFADITNVLTNFGLPCP